MSDYPEQGSLMDVKSHPENNLTDPLASNNTMNPMSTAALTINVPTSQTAMIKQKFKK